MPVEIDGFAQALARCPDFKSVDPARLEMELSNASEPLRMWYAKPSVVDPLIRSGSDFTHLIFVQSGTVVPWQYPHSELAAPFLIGEHEFLVDAERWVGNYSAISEAIVVGIPKRVMGRVVRKLPAISYNMLRLVMRRMARFYWTSLATSGTPSSRVAAALVSRLALEERDFGEDRRIAVKQKDLVRLTNMSRSAVSDGLQMLEQWAAIDLGGGKTRFAGVVRVPDVDNLKGLAFAEVRDRDVLPLLPPGARDSSESPLPLPSG